MRLRLLLNVSSANEALNGQVRGVANRVCEIAVVDRPLRAHEGHHAAGAGAVVEFRGLVRPLEEGSTIAGIEYEAHEQMAEHQLRHIAQQAMALFGLFSVRMEHRIGFVPAGEASLYLRLTSAHRGEAFDASKWIVDELKKRVPIWKTPTTRVPERKTVPK